jgi:hypothetical protein
LTTLKPAEFRTVPGHFKSHPALHESITSSNPCAGVSVVGVASVFILLTQEFVSVDQPFEHSLWHKRLLSLVAM